MTWIFTATPQKPDAQVMEPSKGGPGGQHRVHADVPGQWLLSTTCQDTEHPAVPQRTSRHCVPRGSNSKIVLKRGMANLTLSQNKDLIYLLSPIA